jgi:hypothetical protein
VRTVTIKVVKRILASTTLVALTLFAIRIFGTQRGPPLMEAKSSCSTSIEPSNSARFFAPRQTLRSREFYPRRSTIPGLNYHQCRFE